ncbi:MAG: M1 family metallopeptidase [Flavobacteriales bacterium]|nr:M1 family metallopeptidase [Flavobacteriales bacterium]
MKKVLIIIVSLLVGLNPLFAQEGGTNQNDFRQLKQELATPNVYRTASGAPGHEYYQQQADYQISITLDDEKQTIKGEETITYKNNSPDQLTYLWVQLDQNMRAQDSETKAIATNSIDNGRMDIRDLKKMHSDFDGGFKLEYVKDAGGKDLLYIVNHTMMRIDLPKPLKSGASFSFKIKWWYNINNRIKIGGRSGFEHFENDDNLVYTIAQFFPRMAVYNEVEGWQNKQFLGRGEFTLPFGDYKVSITVPADHIIGATGTLQNAGSVLTTEQQARLKKAKTATEPVLIVTQVEAEATEKQKSSSTKTWIFAAKNVRDFAFATSRKFIWDAMGVKLSNGNTTMAMSYYPKEGNPLWGQYSTRVVAHTVLSYSKHTFDYPYPVAISVHSKWNGMEYPMICFNYGRPEEDGTYTERTKNGMIGVIIHEVGHNFFPMIINSDERQWTWMDEGLNTFVQYMAEREWDTDYPSRRGPPAKIVDYMRGDKNNISPIMVNSESIFQFGNNAYGKPATALVILRETILGRELFDYAFSEYCNRWMFKHPTPADFFRTMEDASGTDLDWFWRGWFYGTEHVDISLDNVNWFRLDTKNPEVESALKKEDKANEIKYIGYVRDEKDIPVTYVEEHPKAIDFYSKYDPFEVSVLDKEDYEKYLSKMDDEGIELISAGYNYYQLDFSNIGGLPMPIIVEFTFVDGTKEKQYIPAEIWRFNAESVSKVFFFKKEVMNVAMDPYLETADVDMTNNNWPRTMQQSRFQVYKSSKYGRRGAISGGENPMQRDKRAEEKAKEQQ